MYTMPTERIRTDESIWARLARPRQPPRSALTHDEIAAAAVALADAEGLDAVTMRRLASRLGVAPMALYRYVAGKQELFQLMVDAVYADAKEPADGSTWRDVLRAYALQTRELTLRHRWLPQVHARSLVVTLTPNRMAASEQALTALAGLGVDADTMMAVLDTVSSYAQGATAAEIAQLRLMEAAGWKTREQLRDALSPHMSWLLATGRYPTYRRYTEQASRKDDFGWRFEIGLDWVLDGIAADVGIS
jgi:AcrR family transcriptional regulator